jgi:WD40 repeat protein
VKLLKADTLESVGTLRGHGEWVWSVAFLSDGKTLVSAGGNFDFQTHTSDRPGELKVWDIAGLTERVSLDGHGQGVRCVALSADGKTLATGDFAGVSRLWDIDALLLSAPVKPQAPMETSLDSEL